MNWDVLEALLICLTILIKLRQFMEHKQAYFYMG